MASSNLVRAQSTDAKAGSLLVSLKFPGGTIKEYLTDVRQKIGDKANIVVTDDRAGAPHLPAMELAEVDVESAVYLIQGMYTLQDGTSVGIYVESIRGPGENGGRPVYRVASSNKGREDAPQVRVWSLSELIGDRIKAEDALTAVELAVSITESGDRTADVRFHEKTSLLVANGTSNQIDAIDSVIEQLLKGERQIREFETVSQGIEDFVGWIEEMRKFDESKKALAAEQAAQQGLPTQPPHSDLRGSYQGGGNDEAGRLREMERLTRLVEDQARKIQSLEQRLGESKKQ